MIFIISMNLDNTNLLADMHLTGFEPIIAKNVQKINFKFTMISIFTTLGIASAPNCMGPLA